MLREREDKELTAKADKCPQCGERRAQCRAVPMGHWCAAKGLLEDQALWIETSPNPLSVAVAADPSVIEAEAEAGAAQAIYDEAFAAWAKAVGDLAGLQAKEGTKFSGGYVMTDRLQAPGHMSGRARRTVESMIEKINATRLVMDDADRALRRANAHHHRMQTRARHALHATFK